MSRTRGLLAAGLVLVAGLGLGTGPAGAAAAATSAGSPGFCTDTVGVTVVVDFQDLGGGVVVRCFAHPTSSSTGLDALKGAGFTTEGTVHDGPAFVCRIDGKPTHADESCISTPPASAYWSYWYAPNHGAWRYSSLGAASHRVIAGGFEGWSFSKNRTATTSPPPRVAPSHTIVAPPPPKPTPTPTVTTKAPTPAGSQPSASAPAAGVPVSPSPGTATAATATAAAPSPSGSAGAQAAGSAPPVSFDATTPDAPGGSPWSSVVGIGLAVAALGGAGAVAVRRRNDRLADGG